jgi:hypothetical protein
VRATRTPRCDRATLLPSERAPDQPVVAERIDHPARALPARLVGDGEHLACAGGEHLACAGGARLSRDRVRVVPNARA